MECLPNDASSSWYDPKPTIGTAPAKTSAKHTVRIDATFPPPDIPAMYTRSGSMWNRSRAVATASKTSWYLSGTSRPLPVSSQPMATRPSSSSAGPSTAGMRPRGVGLLQMSRPDRNRGS